VTGTFYWILCCDLPMEILDGEFLYQNWPPSSSINGDNGGNVNLIWKSNLECMFGSDLLTYTSART
jgi:hypothetical protein